MVVHARLIFAGGRILVQALEMSDRNYEVHDVSVRIESLRLADHVPLPSVVMSSRLQNSFCPAIDSL